MKKVALFFMCAVMAAGFTIPASAADVKLGYIDLAKVFDDYQKTKDFDKQLETKGNAKQAERDKLVTDIKKLRDEAELLSAKAKEDKQAQIDEKIKLLQDFDRTTRDSLRKERDTMVRDILKEIDTVIQDFGKKQGYTYILNDRVLVYKTEADNLTAQVSKALNDSYKKK